MDRVETESVFVYDCVDRGGKFRIDREPNEDEGSYRRRLALYRSLFDRST